MMILPFYVLDYGLSGFCVGIFEVCLIGDSSYTLATICEAFLYDQGKLPHYSADLPCLFKQLELLVPAVLFDGVIDPNHFAVMDLIPLDVGSAVCMDEYLVVSVFRMRRAISSLRRSRYRPRWPRKYRSYPGNP